MAGASRAVVLAMDLLRAPVLAETMRRQPLLPDHEILVLLKIAGGCPEVSGSAARAAGAPVERVRQAAILYLNRVLLFPEADSYRVLGVSPAASHETVREHLRWMMRWLHPDRNRDSWETVFADRVLSAWEDLKSPSRREAYDRRRLAEGGASQTRDNKLGVPWIANPVPLRQQPRRWTDVFRMAVFYPLLAGALALLTWEVASTADPPRQMRNAVDSATLVRLAERQIENAQNVDWREVRRMARRALHANPLETRALVLLALASEAEGDEQKAASLISLAGTRTLRDASIHLRLFDLRFRENDHAAALAHADVLLRVHPRLRSTLLPYLMAMAVNANGRASMIERLETGPPWRGWFLGAFSRQAADPSDPTPLYAALQAGPRPPSNPELRPHLDRLIESGRFENALVVWVASLTPYRAADLDYVYNGDFAHPTTDLPFDWLIGRVSGAEIGIGASPMGKGNGLRVQFGRGRVPFKHVRKLVVLPPGPYELSGNAMSVDLRNDRGLQWSIACAEGEREVLATTSRITGTARTEIAKAFTVPVMGCRAQWLQLELAARIAPEQDVDGGIVWYDSLQIRRVDAVNPS